MTGSVKNASASGTGRGRTGISETSCSSEAKIFPANQNKMSPVSQIFAILTGSSSDAMADATSDERRTIALAGVALLLIGGVTVLGWFIALVIARGVGSLENLPFALLAGLIVYAIDRAMLRRIWSRVGHQLAANRGFRTDPPERKFSSIKHFLIRIVVSVVLSFTTANFLELEIFRQDIQSQIESENRAHNQPLFQEATRNVDTQIDAKREEISRLDAQAASLLNQASKTATVSQSARFAQIEALTVERSELLLQMSKLTKQLACETQNRVAEKTGQVRCDGISATPGTGDRFDFAEEMSAFARKERDAASERIQEIDASLERLQGREGPDRVSSETRDLLNNLSGRRAEATSNLDHLLSDREAIIHARMLENPNYVRSPDGLIVRGEALDMLSKTSAWLRTRIALVFLALLVLDMCAVLVMSIMPAPKSVVFREVLESEVAMARAVAGAESSIAGSTKTIYAAREETARAEEQADEHITELHSRRKTRQTATAIHDAKLEEQLREAC